MFQINEFATLFVYEGEKMPLGDWSSGGTPGPIPNPEVKPASADGTWLETARESRSLPEGFLFLMPRN